MDQRLKLHQILRGICDNVYFQPPTNLEIKYPCIVYSIDSDNTRYADNQKYLKRLRYSVTIIDRDPDSRLLNAVLDLMYTSLDRHFVNDNLHHYVITLYF